ncbi:MAG: DivIVA domain-containing protein [Desulfobulbaceae bacterium]|jgi:cell division initiation protein|nr:DivIVA domain-containing protein [Desulfobulbaceae bacterium]
MSITPQTIKDQEFQTKFRGYDTIEVKAYLDLVAEEFFELLESKRRQDEALAALNNRCQGLADEREDLVERLRENGSAVTNDEESRRARDTELRALRDQIAALMKQVKDVEAEKSALLFAREGRERALAEEVRGLRDKCMLAQQEAAMKEKDIEGLRRQLAANEMQIGELKKDETASKHLIIAAQNFADDLRRKSEKEAHAMLAKARAEVDAFRQKSQEELARLPVEIERLHRQREQVWDELRRTLQTHLEQLDLSSNFKEASPDLAEMFQIFGQPPEARDLTVDELEPPGNVGQDVK